MRVPTYTLVRLSVCLYSAYVIVRVSMCFYICACSCLCVFVRMGLFALCVFLRMCSFVVVCVRSCVIVRLGVWLFTLERVSTYVLVRISVCLYAHITSC